ncbi:MAG: nucleotide exchange factor GrpE [Fuerstiella sp.]|nr:nucleotide exchange factor GrpE [Fuerstiella sp.]
MTDETKNEPELPEDEVTAAEESETSNAAARSLSPDELQVQFEKLQDQLLRGQAELENFRRRSHREADEARKYQSLPIVRDLLPALDNLERAILAAEQTGDVGTLLEGIRMVSQQLFDTLKGHAAQPITAEGQPFDPNLHAALSQVPTDEHPPMTVIQVVESGYLMHDRVVRPAKVIVSCAPPEPESQETTAADADEEE